MRRWAKECITKMNYIPPHALQLQDIIKLSPAMEVNLPPLFLRCSSFYIIHFILFKLLLILTLQQIPERGATVTEPAPVGSGQELPARKVRSGENSHEQLFVSPLSSLSYLPFPSYILPPHSQSRCRSSPLTLILIVLFYLFSLID